MGSLTGFNTKAGIKKATTWGTAVAAGAGNQLNAEIVKGLNPSTFKPRQIGSGNSMTPTLTLGAKKPQVTLTGDAGFHNNFPLILAAFFGTAAVSAEITTGQADYRHTLTWNNSSRTGTYLTFAYQDTDSSAREFPTCVVQGISIKTGSIPGLLEYTATLYANDMIVGVTNTFSSLNSVTLPDQETVKMDYVDTWWMGLQSAGALSSGDQTNITSWSLDIQQPMEFVDEIKGASGLGVPRITDLATVKLSLGLKENANQTWLNAFIASTIYKAKLVVNGSQIGTGLNKAYTFYLPGLEMVSDPKDDLTKEGTNPATLEFEGVFNNVQPTGMTSKYPYVEIVNGLSTALLA